MTIGVVNWDRGYGKKFFELCDKIRLAEGVTAEYLLEHGFTNHHEPTLYYCRGIMKKNYHVSLNISIDKKTLEIKSIDLLNDEFLQPHVCNQMDYEQSKGYINKLVKDGVLILEEAA